MIILVLNSGSSSVKFQLINMDERRVMASGGVEKVGFPEGIITIKAGESKTTWNMEFPNHEVAVDVVLNTLLATEEAGLICLDQIDAVGHRVVQGGDSFSEAALIDNEVFDIIEEYGAMAPLHNPAHLKGVEACNMEMPGTPQIAVFDTAFHQTMEPYVYTYGIPMEYTKKYKIRKYGAHGTSHRYVANRVAALMNRPIGEMKIITCHLGNGASITAVNKGKVMDTSMGFTPHEGLLMGTRCGDIDATAVLYLMRQEGFDAQQMDYILNRRSGLLGVSGVSSDLRDVEKGIAEGKERAELARNMMVYRIKKYIGSYVAAMNGVDAIVFTAGMGEKSVNLRRDICADMDYLGIQLDEDANAQADGECRISKDSSRVEMWVVPTNEEMEIAEQVQELVEKAEREHRNIHFQLN